MAGQNDLLGDFVELGILVGRQWVILAVDRTSLKGRVDLGESDRHRVGAERLAQKLPGVGAGHAKLHAREICRRHNLLFDPQVELPAPEIHHGQELHAELGLDLLLHFIHEARGEYLLLVLGVAMQIAGGEYRPGGIDCSQLLRRRDRHLEIAASDRLKFRPLLEKRCVPVGLEGGKSGYSRREHLNECNRALVRWRRRRRKAQKNLVGCCSAKRRHANSGASQQRRSAAGANKRPSRNGFHLAFLPLVFFGFQALRHFPKLYTFQVGVQGRLGCIDEGANCVRDRSSRGSPADGAGD